MKGKCFTEKKCLGIFRGEEEAVWRSQIASSSDTNKENNNAQKHKGDLSQKQNMLEILVSGTQLFSR